MNLYWCSFCQEHLTENYFCFGFNFQMMLKFQTLPSSWKIRSRMSLNDNFLQKSIFPLQKKNPIFSSCTLILPRWKCARTAQSHGLPKPFDNQNTCSPETAALTKHWAHVIKKSCMELIRNLYLFLERSRRDSSIEEKRKRRRNTAQARGGAKKKPAHTRPKGSATAEENPPQRLQRAPRQYSSYALVPGSSQEMGPR